MGYEVTYHYHERTDEGYNKDETKTFKKKVGQPFDDTTLEKLAAAVMAQLARRDVWIVDVEIFELSKKAISFKEAKGGIILKNKKFLFDGGGEDASTITVQDMMAPASAPQYTAQQYVPPQNIPPQNVNIQQAPVYHDGNLHPHEQGMPRRPIDYVIFMPELHLMTEVKQKNLRFTPDKKYAVYEKRPAPMGETYVMLDDTKREQLVSDKYFVPANVQLSSGFIDETPQQKDGGKLQWGSTMQEDMIDVRRR